MSKVKVGFRWNTFKNWQVRMAWQHLVPAHMRNLWPMRNTPHLAPKQLQPVNLSLGMMIGEQLHTEADTQKRLALLSCLANRVVQSTFYHAFHCCAARTHARQHNCPGLLYYSRVICDCHLRSQVFQCFSDAADIARAIINNRDHRSSLHAEMPLLPICTACASPNQLITVGKRSPSIRLTVSKGQHIKASCT